MEISRNIHESHEASRTRRSAQQQVTDIYSGWGLQSEMQSRVNKRFLFQLKLCGNQLINMLRIICGIYRSGEVGIGGEEVF